MKINDIEPWPQAWELDDLDENFNPIHRTHEEKMDDLTMSIVGSLEYCATCNRWTVPASHRCEGDNLVIWKH